MFKIYNLRSDICGDSSGRVITEVKLESLFFELNMHRAGVRAGKKGQPWSSQKKSGQKL